MSERLKKDLQPTFAPTIENNCLNCAMQLLITGRNNATTKDLCETVESKDSLRPLILNYCATLLSKKEKQ